MSDHEFSFEAEFALLDVGATSSMLRTGAVRPTVLVFTRNAGVESIALDWMDPQSVERAFEEARRFARDHRAVAYALIAHYVREHGRVRYVLPGEAAVKGFEFLGLAMYDLHGNGRSVSYPIRRAAGSLTFGMPIVSDSAATDWCLIGDIWGNPFCAGDVVKFRSRERALDPSGALWQSIVELTRMRIHDDPANSQEYMDFLDDLRNGIFVVAGRPQSEPGRVHLRSRTVYNPIGTLTVDASRLLVSEQQAADVQKIDGLEQAALR